MFALLAILGTGLAIFAGEAVAIGRHHPARPAQCADCHSPDASSSDVLLRERSCGKPADVAFAIVVDTRTGAHTLVRDPACMSTPASSRSLFDYGR